MKENEKRMNNDVCVTIALSLFLKNKKYRR
jgi:hypothetical protein